MKTYSNLINGKDFSFSKKIFLGRSPYYDYGISIVNANEMDIDYAVGFAKGSQDKLRKLGFVGRKTILKKAAEKLSFDFEDLRHATMMMGMPIKYVSLYMNEAQKLLSGYSDSLEQRLQLINGRLSRIFQNSGYVEIKDTIPGFAYSIVPSNDPRAMSFVFSVLSTLGIPGVLKISKNELPIAHKIAKAAIYHGYPANALNLLCWDTEDQNRARALHFHIFKKHDPSFFIPFGNDETVDEQLRYEDEKFIRPESLSRYLGQSLDEKIINEITETEKIDRLRGNVFRHTSGNCALIVDGNSNFAVQTAGYSAFEYPISCKSAKSLYFVGDQSEFEKFKEGIKEYASNLTIGDPLDPRTDVGYVDEKTLDEVLNKVEELKRLGQLELICGGLRINKHQATPLVISTDDYESPFLTKENSIYILTLTRVDTLENAVDECNIPRFKERLAVSVISNREDIEFGAALSDLSCDQWHLNQITRFLHPPGHQGIMYPERMSRTISGFLGIPKIQAIPLKQEMQQLYRVLFIEDEREIASNLVEQMTLIYDEDAEFKKRNNFEALIAYSGEEGIETAIRNQDIKVVVTDMRMGGISGGQALKEIRKHIPNVVGIVVTGYADEADKQDSIKGGAVKYITKPYDPGLLWTEIKLGLLDI